MSPKLELLIWDVFTFVAALFIVLGAIATIARIGAWIR